MPPYGDLRALQPKSAWTPDVVLYWSKAKTSQYTPAGHHKGDAVLSKSHHDRGVLYGVARPIPVQKSAPIVWLTSSVYCRGGGK